MAQAQLLPRVGCPRACGILGPQPGSKPASLALEGRFSTPGPLGKSLLQQRRWGRWGEGTPTHSFLVGIEVQVPRSASLHLKWGGVFITDEQGGTVLAPLQAPRDNSLAGRGWFASTDTVGWIQGVSSLMGMIGPTGDCSGTTPVGAEGSGLHV